jgi:hypothetical protein
MTCRKALERWETKIGKYELTHQVIWPTVKSLIKRDRPKAPTAIHGPLASKYQLLDIVTMNAD